MEEGPSSDKEQRTLGEDARRYKFKSYHGGRALEHYLFTFGYLFGFWIFWALIMVIASTLGVRGLYPLGFLFILGLAISYISDKLVESYFFWTHPERSWLGKVLQWLRGSRER
ncbi:MAG: hypothetical protein ACFFGZ_07895 [Candidatus Thorarchaeota archaeon]